MRNPLGPEKGHSIYTGSSCLPLSGARIVSFFGGSEEIFHMEESKYLLRDLFPPKAGTWNYAIQNGSHGGNSFRLTLWRSPNSQGAE